MEEEDCPPARKVVSRSPAKTVRLLNLRGIWDSPVECESTLERDFVYRIALCPGVVRLKHQPFRMKLAAGNIYTPDFLASHRDGSVSVIEVKPKEKVAAYLHVFDEASTKLAARGVTFTVLTEERIRRPTLAALHQRRVLLEGGVILPISRLRKLERMGLIPSKGRGPTADGLRERARVKGA